MSRSLSLAEVKAHFSECVREAEEGASIVVTRHGRPVVALVPADDLETLVGLRASGPVGGLASVAGRFDDVPDFAEALDGIVQRRDRRPTPTDDRPLTVSDTRTAHLVAGLPD